MDLFPTFLELANISLPVDRAFDGISLVSSVLHNKKFDRLFWFHVFVDRLLLQRLSFYQKLLYHNRTWYNAYPYYSTLKLAQVASTVAKLFLAL